MQEKSKQRGVMQLTTGLLLAAAAGLAALSGCSAEIEPAAGEESLGEVQEAITCTTVVDCPEDSKCGRWSCLKGTCTVIDPAKDGAECELKAGAGRCLEGMCCLGCVEQTLKGSTCRKGSEVQACGRGGDKCQDCDQGSSCEIYLCDARKGQCDVQKIADGDKCDGEPGFCNQGSCCAGCIDEKGGCQPGNTLTQCGVSSEKLLRCKDCSDSSPCTADACVAGACQAPPVKPGTSCDDGNVCNGVSECSGTTCTAGTPLNCDDGNPCTIDSCDPVKGCTYTPDPGASCNDGDPCTTGEKCDANGKCGGGVVNSCDDNEPCTADACKEGKCVNTPVKAGTSCDDGNGCTTTDTCNDSGKCVGTGGPSCDDDKPCTKNACAANVCDNPFEPSTTPCIYDKCTQNSHCSGVSDECVPGTSVDCNDNNPCTTDSCDPEVGCVHVPNDAAECVDGDACTVDDECKNGVCVGTPMPCLAIDACHEAGTCNPLTGRCDDPRAEDGKECPGGSCASGVCEPDPLTGEGGAGGAGEGEGGAAGASGMPAEGGSVGVGGAADAGSPAEPAAGGESGENAFVRKPGGCSCRVPTSSSPSGLWLAGAALALALGRRRRGRSQVPGERL